ncbi:MAG: beta-lactamase family protein [Myxococcales bacterium]|nr:beta-lactamase family protein [Myxococcales bacterium]
MKPFHYLHFLLPLALVACSASAPAPAPAAPVRVERHAAAQPAHRNLGPWVDAYVSGFGKHWGPAFRPRGYLIVARAGEPILQRAYGDPAPDADTAFHIASLTKQFTAVAVLRQVDAGKISLDASVRSYLPDLPEALQPVTITQLLHHTSGIADYTQSPKLEPLAKHPTPHAAVLELFVHQPLAFPPGSKFDYSNSNYFLLGMVLEKVTSQPYAALLKSQILDPTGMTHSGADGPTRRIDLAQGHSVHGADQLVTAEPDDPSVAFSAGAIYTSASDLLKWDRALANGTLLSPRTETFRTTPAKGDYACGVVMDSFQGVLYEVHSGAISGFDADLVRVPERDLLIAFLGNNDGFDSSRITRKVLKMILTERPEAPIEERPLGHFDATAGEGVVGDYRLTAASRQALRGKLPDPVVEGVSVAEVAIERDGLRVTHAGERPFHLFPAVVSNTYFTKGSGIEVRFGQAGFVLRQAGFELQYERADSH